MAVYAAALERGKADVPWGAWSGGLGGRGDARVAASGGESARLTRARAAWAALR